MKSLEELKALRESMQSKMNLRKEDTDTIRVVVGMATCGIAAGARPVLNAFVEEVNKRELKNVQVTQTGLHRRMSAGAHCRGLRPRTGEGHLCEDDPGKGAADCGTASGQ